MTFNKRILIALLFMLTSTGMAAADSCWDHNGSLMRLQSNGAQRWLVYESPRQALWNAGVQNGTLLFDGRNNGDWYSGTARVFSRHCPGNPLMYFVEGPVLQNPLRILLRGTREVHKNCNPTGRWTEDTLIFTYRFNC